MDFRRVLLVVPLLLLAIVSGCQYKDQPRNGQQLCALPQAKLRCPEGYFCASDNHCWLVGTIPGPGPAAAVSPSGALVPAGGLSSSSRHIMIKTTGRPATSGIRESGRHRLLGVGPLANP